MNFTAWIARLLGYRNVEAIDEISSSFAAPWAHDHPLLIALACFACIVLALTFYARLQPQRRPLTRVGLGLCRAALICLLLLFLAEPTLVLKLTSHPRPSVWLLFDGTDSMAIQDDLSESERRKLDEAVAMPRASASNDEPAKHSRIEYVQSLLARRDDNLLERLEEKFRVKVFRFDRPDGVTTLKLAADEGKPADPATLTPQLTTRGQVTALGAALADLGQRHATNNLAGIVVFSDFDQNAGPSAITAARQLAAPIYAVGVGPAAAVDVAVDLQAPLLMKKDERSNLVVTIRQNGFDGRTVPLRVTTRHFDSGSDSTPSVTIAQQSVLLSGLSVPVDVGYTPSEIGRFQITAEVQPQEGEVIQQNNVSQREVSVRDDFLRLMYVEYQPTWEWRFIKEVFHRDQLVGMRGFRTFLRSADPKVRQTNELFLSTMTPPRSDFFANDVIFLGDMPAATLSTRFCDMTKEFVSTFGGGLVIVSGPGFGPGQLASTSLSEMLPVVVDADAKLRDERLFTPTLTPYASQFDFMQLGVSASDNQQGWANLGQLPWYQPVSRVHPLATVLLEHPHDTCIDGKTRQPLIAIRRYGRGEVVYLSFDETWRLRRKYGETYYRQFWGQMIHRLGLSHALGSQKRFVVRTDRQQYQSDDKVVLTVEAYNENFEPLVADKLPDHKIWGELQLPSRATAAAAPPTLNSVHLDGENRQPLPIPQLRPGVFEAQIPVFVAGEHRVKVKDPITGETVEVNFQVTSLSAERRSAVRNTAIQEQLAAGSGGKSYDLTTAAKLPDEIRSVVRTESTMEVFPLWNTWPCFVLVIALMLGEWLLRKLVNLA